MFLLVLDSSAGGRPGRHFIHVLTVGTHHLTISQSLNIDLDGKASCIGNYINSAGHVLIGEQEKLHIFSLKGSRVKVGGKFTLEINFSLIPCRVIEHFGFTIRSLIDMGSNSVWACCTAKDIKMVNVHSGKVGKLLPFPNGEIASAVARGSNAKQILTIHRHGNGSRVVSYNVNSDSISCEGTLFTFCSPIKHVVCFKSQYLYFTTSSNIITVATSLKFAQEYFTAVHCAYKACGYLSDSTKAGDAVKPSSDETFEHAKTFGDYFNNFKDAALSRCGTKSVAGPNGCPASKSIECLTATVRSMDISKQRLKILRNANDNKLKAYTLINESYIEHGFGAQPDSTLKSLRDYAIGQRNARLLMLQRHTITGFSDPVEYRKRYMEIPSERKLPAEKIAALVTKLAITLEGHPKFMVVSSSRSNEEHKKTLQLLNIAKAQPRRSTRDKYKAESGFGPTTCKPVLPSITEVILFHQHDVIAFTTHDDCQTLLIVEENVKMDDFKNHGLVKGSVLIECDDSFQIGPKTCVAEAAILRDNKEGSYFVYPGVLDNSNCVLISPDFFTDLDALRYS